MARKKGKSTSDKPETTLVCTLLDGPRAGSKLQLPNPPPRYIKVAFPEWAVYEVEGRDYRLRFTGNAARAWRNPIRPLFGDPLLDGSPPAIK